MEGEAERVSSQGAGYAERPHELLPSAAQKWTTVTALEAGAGDVREEQAPLEELLMAEAEDEREPEEWDKAKQAEEAEAKLEACGEATRTGAQALERPLVARVDAPLAYSQLEDVRAAKFACCAEVYDEFYGQA